MQVNFNHSQKQSEEYSVRLDFKKLPVHYTFSNCFDLSPQVLNDFLVKVLANAKHIPRERQQELNKPLAFSFCGPSPPNQNSALDLQPGSSVVTRLNPSWRNTLMGFAMLVEVAFSEDYCDATGFGIRSVCRWKNKEGHSQRIERNLQFLAPGKAFPKVQKDHMFVFVDVDMLQSTDAGNDPNIWADLVVFEFFPTSKQTKPLDDSCKVTRCGVRVINAATGYTGLEDISLVLSSDPLEVSGNEVEVLRVLYDGLQEMNKVLFLYIACLFNDEDVDLVAPLIASSIGLDVTSGLKVLANRSLIHISSDGGIGMHCLPRQMGKEILHTESMLPGSSKRYERLVGSYVQKKYGSYVRKKKRKGETEKVVCIPAVMNSQSSRNVVPSDLWDWHKYGQKDILGASYPRSYYRCIYRYTRGCKARKQAQRSDTDPNMIVITYTSEHNHPWPTERNALTGSSSSFSNPSSKPSTVTTSASSSVYQNKDEPSFTFPSYVPTVVNEDVEEHQVGFDNDTGSLGSPSAYQHPEDLWADCEGDSPTMLHSHNSSGGNMENKAIFE